MKLNILEFFIEFQDDIYCVIKPDEKLPLYAKGSDVDIFCYDSQKLIKKIFNVGNKYIEHGLEIHVSNFGSQYYVDFFNVDDNSIEFRFDIYIKLPNYSNVLIKPSFFEVVLENRVTKKIYDECYIFIPNNIDNCILRYIEYQEWYGVRPDKIKHIDYILNFCNEQDRNIFLQKLHYYTEIPKAYSEYPKKFDWRKQFNIKLFFIFKNKLKKLIQLLLW